MGKVVVVRIRVYLQLTPSPLVSAITDQDVLCVFDNVMLIRDIDLISSREHDSEHTGEVYLFTMPSICLMKESPLSSMTIGDIVPLSHLPCMRSSRSSSRR